jgi:hypothetical protein
MLLADAFVWLWHVDSSGLPNGRLDGWNYVRGRDWDIRDNIRA